MFMTGTARHEDGWAAGSEPGTEGAQGSVAGDYVAIEAIMIAGRAMDAIATRALGHSDGNVTLAQFRTLLALTDHNRRLLDLAESLRVSPPSATRMCDRLVRKGFITRQRDPVNRREVILDITVAGRKVIADAMARCRGEVGAVLEQMPLEELSRLVGSLYVFTAAATGNRSDMWPELPVA
jgi:DNA-binding MarR family transcriptional regulator